ncbi:MAG: hypothetical protein D6732_10255 [Methanobacteriota archaeon]|nr:MAG: hypothetical protein D6732_10255 [Euryarchaeota archaeon]
METFFRLAFWHVILLTYVLIFPVLHQLLGKESLSTLPLRTYSLFVISIGAIEVGFFAFDLGYSEFQTILLILTLFFHLNIFRRLGVRVESTPLDVPSLDRDIISKINRSLHGNAPDDTDSGLEFEIKNIYQMRFVISGHNNENVSWFQILVVPSPLTTLIHITAIYFSVLSLWDTSTETTAVHIPGLSSSIDAITLIIVSLVASGVLLYMEFSSANTIALELPLLYKKILTKASLDEARKKTMVQPVSSTDEPSEMEKARARAREILSARQSDILYRKRDELKNKVDEIFATEENKIGLDPETLERVRLYNSVKRILISTPPWQTAKLGKIADLADGDPEKVELIIGTLIEKNEVPGIYDIWNQIYYGTPFSQWFTNEVFKEIKRGTSSIKSVRIHPDGSADISLESSGNEKKELE